MELAAHHASPPLALARRLAARLDRPAIAAWTLGFTVVAYLALRNGGYDTIVRSQVGIAVWWIVLLGALSGILPSRFGAAGWTATGLLTGFALWTGVAIGWTESAERSAIELGRVAMYLGVFVLAIALGGRTAARHTINGLACAIGFVTLLAVLSRLHPQWFPTNDHAEFLGATTARRLSYPLNYWNGLAVFAAIGVPLLLAIAIAARTRLGQALAAGTLPVSALCVYLTISRGGALALVVGIVAFLVFAPRRPAALATLLAAGAGSAVLLAAASQRDAVQSGTVTATATQQGAELIWLTVIVCAGVALLQVAIALVARHVARPPVLTPSRRTTVLGALAVVAVACAVGVSVGAPGWAGDRWQEFKAPSAQSAPADADNVFSRLQVANGNTRYQIWQFATEINATKPWRGIGPGTFEFWWARHGTSPGFIRDAHSLYFETFAETGIVGFVLLAGMLTFLLGAAVARALRGPPGTRIWIAAAVGGLAAFMTSAAFEWVWELAAVACAAMVLGAVVLAGRGDDGGLVDDTPRRPHVLLARGALSLLAAATIVAIAVPMAGALASHGSRDAAAEGRVDAALAQSDIAQRLQPYAATPHLQRALVLEKAGSLEGAAVAARKATVNEPTNWRTWLVLARINAQLGEHAFAVLQFRKAQRLNPRSPLLGAR